MIGKRVQTQDRHEHGGLPDTAIYGYTFRDCVGPWLYGLHKGADGHVTVTCHCALCERFRRLMSHSEGGEAGQSR